MDYFILKGTQTEGPFSEDDLRSAVAEGRLTEADLVRSEEGRLWTRLGKVFEERDASRDAASSLLTNSGRASSATFAEKARFSRAALIQRVEEDPLPIGLIAVAVTSMIAYLARWPILLALPGIALGVCCGLLLIVRNRPILGGVLSLAALLLPLKLLPSLQAPEEVLPVATPPATASIPPTIPPATGTPIPALPATPSLTSDEEIAAAELALPPEAPSAEIPAPEPRSPLASGEVPAATAALVPLAPGVSLPASASLPAQPEDVVYSIDTGKGRGSGFIAGIGEKVYFFTNHHVLEGAEKVTVRGGVQPPQSLGAIIEIADDRDLVRVPLAERSALHFATQAQPGEPIAAFGENGTRPTRIEGALLGVGARECEVSTNFTPANSGGPIFNAAGEVLGVATYALRPEEMSAWLKSGTRSPTARRFALRVGHEIRWERMLLSAYQANSARVAEMDAILVEMVGFAHQLAQKPFRSEIATRFPQRNELRAWVDLYNQNTRLRMMPNPGKMRDYARRLMQTVILTQAAMESDVRSTRLTPSKGILKKREDELLRFYGKLSEEIASVFGIPG